MVAEYAGHKFSRCPATFIGSRELTIIERARGDLGRLTARERRRLTPKMLAALEHAKFLIDLKHAQEGGAA